ERSLLMAESHPAAGGHRPSPPLHLGWLLEERPAKVPVNLRAEGLAAHTAVIAQSGSGKSFMLGRLLEEIASKTMARVLILDPNSDFGQFGAVADEDWKFEGDDPEEFKRRWGQVGCTTVTWRSFQSFPAGLQRHVAFISLSWARLREAAQAAYLGIFPGTHPE